MELRLALLARPGGARENYLAALRGLAQVDAAGTVPEFLGLLRQDPYQGLLIDIPTQIKSTATEKDELASILGRFPTARLNWRADSGQISVLVLGVNTGGDYGLADFIDNQCRHGLATPVRSANRIEMHLNLVLYSQPPGEGSAGERTVTLNLSWGGCFILSCQDWQLGQRAWVVIQETASRRPIQVEVRWAQPWGQARRLPGIGCLFLDLDLEQAQEIVDLLGG